MSHLFKWMTFIRKVRQRVLEKLLSSWYFLSELWLIRMRCGGLYIAIVSLTEKRLQRHYIGRLSIHSWHFRFIGETRFTNDEVVLPKKQWSMISNTFTMCQVLLRPAGHFLKAYDVSRPVKRRNREKRVPLLVELSETFSAVIETLNQFVGFLNPSWGSANHFDVYKGELSLPSCELAKKRNRLCAVALAQSHLFPSITPTRWKTEIRGTKARQARRHHQSNRITDESDETRR